MKLNKADSITDDLEPLFDYRRVQSQNIVCIDDDCSGTSHVPSSKRRKLPNSDAVKVDSDNDVEVIKVVNVEEEDWLAPTPMVSTNANSKIAEDSTIKELSDKINPTATPTSLEMEDNDIIEVHVKKS